MPSDAGVQCDIASRRDVGATASGVESDRDFDAIQATLRLGQCLCRGRRCVLWTGTSSSRDSWSRMARPRSGLGVP